jgi:hypothetical protein
VVASFALAALAKALVRVRRVGGAVAGSKQTALLAAGRHTVVVNVARRARAGRYSVALVLTDTCAERKQRTRFVRVPANG